MDGKLGKVLLVDDDENICEVVKMYVENSGFDIKIVNDGKRAQIEYINYKPDIVLLDVMLPLMDGIDILKWIRLEVEVPVIMLTSRADIFDKVLTLDLGADDYIVKPFEPKELIARIKAVMRRYSVDSSNKETLHFSEINIDAKSFLVTYRGKRY